MKTVSVNEFAALLSAVKAELVESGVMDSYIRSSHDAESCPGVVWHDEGSPHLFSELSHEAQMNVIAWSVMALRRDGRGACSSYWLKHSCESALKACGQEPCYVANCAMKAVLFGVLPGAGPLPGEEQNPVFHVTPRFRVGR